MSEVNIRFVTTCDIPQILAIYEPYIINTNITFEYEVPSLEAFTLRVASISTSYPYLVAEKDGEIIGYAYANKHNERVAYQWGVDLSIYMKECAKGTGIAKELYEKLLALLKLQGMYKAYALITTGNPASERFHERLGFKCIGIMKETGYKLGRWSDVGYYDLTIQMPSEDPIVPLTMTALKACREVEYLIGMKTKENY